MRPAHVPLRIFMGLLLVLAPMFSPGPHAQTVVQARDPQAVAMLQKSIAAMGTVPSDSTASGNVTLVAGGQTLQGTLELLTRSTNQTSMTVQAGTRNWSVIYSNGEANLSQAGTSTSLPLEAVMSSQSCYFPLPFLNAILSNSDYSITDIGPETLSGSNVTHIQVQNTFASNPLFQSLSGLTTTDIWINSTTFLPQQISFVRRSAGGSTPGISVAVSFANYQTLGGTLYPYQIQEALNGTPWATFNIQSVVLSTGLTDANFPVTVGAN
jgi:hypothetical protein